MTQALCHDLGMKRFDCLAATFFDIPTPSSRTTITSRSRITKRQPAPGPTNSSLDTRTSDSGVFTTVHVRTHHTHYSGHVGLAQNGIYKYDSSVLVRCHPPVQVHLSSLRSREDLRHPLPLSRRAPFAVCSPRPRRASKHLRAPSSLGASAETACRRRRRARRPTRARAGSRYRGRSTPPRQCCPSKVCHLRPRRAGSAPGGK